MAPPRDAGWLVFENKQTVSCGVLLYHLDVLLTAFRQIEPSYDAPIGSGVNVYGRCISSIIANHPMIQSRILWGTPFDNIL